MGFGDVGVIGTGYVGLIAALCIAKRGRKVVAYDNCEAKIHTLANGISPITEPRVQEYLESCLTRKTLRCTSDLEEVMRNCSIVFSCLPTPSREDTSNSSPLYVPSKREINAVQVPPDGWQADTRILESVFSNIANRLTSEHNNPFIFVSKSTATPGTCRKLTEIAKEKGMNERIIVVSNPETLREGRAIEDFEHPDRVITGYQNEKERLRVYPIMEEIFRPFLHNAHDHFAVSFETAELAKYTANLWLAGKISLANITANISEVIGADYNDVRKIAVKDQRLGDKFWYAGPGYGGSCFPKDLKAIAWAAHSRGLNTSLLIELWKTNELQKHRMADKIESYFQMKNESLATKKVAVWGLSFKPQTDDIREAPSITIVHDLLRLGAWVTCYDPIPGARANFERLFKGRAQHLAQKLEITSDQYQSCIDADALVTITEHDEFETPNFGILYQTMHNHALFDGKNRYNPQEVKNAGFYYEGVGRR